MVTYSEEMNTTLQSDDRVPSGQRYPKYHHHNHNDNPTTLGQGKTTSQTSGEKFLGHASKDDHDKCSYHDYKLHFNTNPIQAYLYQRDNSWWIT